MKTHKELNLPPNLLNGMHSESYSGAVVSGFLQDSSQLEPNVLRTLIMPVSWDGGEGLCDPLSHCFAHLRFSCDP